MKQIRFHTRTKARGFTLIEIIIVAALIALFSEIAMISASYLASQSKIKAATADERTLSDALSVAKMEFRFYPKICYLSLPRLSLTQAAVRAGRGSLQIPPDFDSIGFDNAQAPRVLLPRSREILDKWQGPYFPSPAGRAKVCKVRLPHQPSNVAPDELFEWPSDPWGNPYVVYLVGTRFEAGTEIPDWTLTPYQDPVYYARVVSYGPNGIPGGQARINEGLEPTLSLKALRDEAEKYKLYRKEGTHFVMLLPVEYGDPTNRILALHSNMPDLGAGAGYMMGTAFKDKVPGIMDAGSDDITVPLH